MKAPLDVLRGIEAESKERFTLWMRERLETAIEVARLEGAVWMREKAHGVVAGFPSLVDALVAIDISAVARSTP